jgi:2-phospho-L-lactate guanylyltransferase
MERHFEMSLWAIVPVKPLRRGKSRLAGVLSEDERTWLNYSMLAQTLKTLAAVPEVTETLVVSRDSAALALARELHARTVQEEGMPELNAALRRATAFASLYAAGGILILPADLPLLIPGDIQEMIALAKDPPVVVIAPDRRRQGTNALLVRPPGLIDYAYGRNSFKRHFDRAVKADIRIEVCEIPSIAIDLDLPDDLELLRNMDILPANPLFTDFISFHPPMGG